MRAASREARGQDYAQRLQAGRCHLDPKAWSELEARYERNKRTRASREAILDEAVERFCGGCPAYIGCAEQANVTGYSGLAAGAEYADGQRRHVASSDGSRKSRRAS
jgi:hypothetical protein